MTVDFSDAGGLGRNGIELTYNGVTFNNTTLVDFRAEYQQDRARRTIVATILRMTFRGVVVYDAPGGGLTVPQQMREARKLLSRQGGDLYVLGTPFGDFSVNARGGQAVLGGDFRDLAWGPIPRVLPFKSLGGDRAGEIEWHVETAINESCPDGLHRGLMEFYYRLNFTTDASGYTTRRYIGGLRVAATRRVQGDRRIPDSAENYRDLVVKIPEVPGYRRVPGIWELSEDKLSATFTLTDEQIPPIAPPKNIVTLDARHAVRAGGRALVRQYHTLQGSYEVPYTIARREGFQAFLDLVGERLASIVVSRGYEALYAKALSIEEDIHGRGVGNFSLTFLAAMGLPQGVDYLTQATRVMPYAMWQDPTGAGWADWAQSMRDSLVWDTRGTTQLAFNTADDLIWDLCAGGNIRTVRSGASAGGRRQLRGFRIPPALATVGAPPTPENSWIEYHNVVTISQTDETVEMKTLPTSPIRSRELHTTPQTTQGWKDGYGHATASKPRSLLQRRAGPTTVVTVEGQAVRAWYDISPPQLTRAGGVECVPANREGQEFFSTGIMGNYLTPLVAAAWRLRYLLPQPPRNPVGAPDSTVHGSALPAKGGSAGGGLDGFTARTRGRVLVGGGVGPGIARP